MITKLNIKVSIYYYNLDFDPNKNNNNTQKRLSQTHSDLNEDQQYNNSEEDFQTDSVPKKDQIVKKEQKDTIDTDSDSKIEIIDINLEKSISKSNGPAAPPQQMTQAWDKDIHYVKVEIA